MKIGVIADDFTGASDIAATLSKEGMSVMQLIGVPKSVAQLDVDAGVIALKTRTVPALEAVSSAIRACNWLTAQGCTQVIFKICSTFDSTDEGNIGPVATALMSLLGEEAVAVCPAYPANGRSVYLGHLFIGDRLLSESGMENHPLTPMRDPDIRRVLARQTRLPVTHIPLSTVLEGSVAIEAALDEQRQSLVIIDAVGDPQLREIGKAVRTRRLLVGGSGIALGLPANFGCTTRSPSWVGVGGPAAVLSGSCSTATRNQVKHFVERAPSRELKAEAVMSGGYDIGELTDWVVSQPAAPMLYSSADPEVVARAQIRFGTGNLAAAFDSLFAALATALADAGVKRFVVAGGETSGAVVAGLGADMLEIGPEIATGVPAVKIQGLDIALALKSGNFGPPQFFSQALETLEGRPYAP